MAAATRSRSPPNSIITRISSADRTTTTRFCSRASQGMEPAAFTIPSGPARTAIAATCRCGQATIPQPETSRGPELPRSMTISFPLPILPCRPCLPPPQQTRPRQWVSRRPRQSMPTSYGAACRMASTGSCGLTSSASSLAVGQMVSCLHRFAQHCRRWCLARPIWSRSLCAHLPLATTSPRARSIQTRSG